MIISLIFNDAHIVKAIGVFDFCLLQELKLKTEPEEGLKLKAEDLDALKMKRRKGSFGSIDQLQVCQFYLVFFGFSSI